MYRAGFLVVLCLVTLTGLWSNDLEWGLKYGIGSSTLHGPDEDYVYRYDFYLDESLMQDLGSVSVRSDENDSGLAHNAGVYANIILTRKTDSIRLGSELLWQRYSYSHSFKNARMNPSSILLAEVFTDSLSGKIDRTVDYLSLPILLSFHQELSEEKKAQSYQGAFVYLGPAISLKLSQSHSSTSGVRGFEGTLQNYLESVSNDGNDATPGLAIKQKSGSDKYLALKSDFVFGAGFTLKDIFGFGFGKDTFDFDFRVTMGLNELGDTSIRDAIILRSLIFSVGYRL